MEQKEKDSTPQNHTIQFLFLGLFRDTCSEKISLESMESQPQCQVRTGSGAKTLIGLIRNYLQLVYICDTNGGWFPYIFELDSNILHFLNFRIVQL